MRRQGSGRKRGFIYPELVKSIRRCAVKNPNFSLRYLANKYNVSHSYVRKIKMFFGIYPYTIQEVTKISAKTLLPLLISTEMYGSMSKVNLILVPSSIQLTKMIEKSCCDVVCIIDRKVPKELEDQFEEYRLFDKAFDSSVSCFKSLNLNLPVVYSPLIEIGDYHDVRVYQQAAAASLSRAIKAGFQSPLLIIPESKKFLNAPLCTILGALEELYVPIQLREDVPEKGQRVTGFFVMIAGCSAEEIFTEALILESGRFVARDIGGADPERMTALRIEEYIRKLFTSLSIEVISDVDVLTKEYPLFAAVNRAANQIKRHRGRIIFLEYKPPKAAKKTLMLVGKGVTYDTGGADIKVGGGMIGMSRDKCGAATVAGFMQVVCEKKPKDVHVIGAMCLVRNSVGEDSYVADEIITSRAGLRVRIGNTDAEGRMAMADPLCRMKERAIAECLPDVHLYTIATLTGHAGIAVGPGYTIAMDNSVARQDNHARKLQQVGTSFGEPFEVSVLRQCDFDFNKGKVIGEDLVQCNNQPSSRTFRGHQIPAAFLIQVTGLDKHDLNSQCPLKYTHLDIAASAGEFPKIPTAAPIVALVKTHLS